MQFNKELNDLDDIINYIEKKLESYNNDGIKSYLLENPIKMKKYLINLSTPIDDEFEEYSKNLNTTPQPANRQIF